jgi:hypothetical protein
MQGFLLDIL